jgi:hypothetical protein
VGKANVNEIDTRRRWKDFKNPLMFDAQERQTEGRFKRIRDVGTSDSKQQQPRSALFSAAAASEVNPDQRSKVIRTGRPGLRRIKQKNPNANVTRILSKFLRVCVPREGDPTRTNVYGSSSTDIGNSSHPCRTCPSQIARLPNPRFCSPQLNRHVGFRTFPML